MMRPGALLAADALLPTGWARNVRIEWDENGVITSVIPSAGRHDGEVAIGPVIPGMPNLHCHAFQRAFAGLCEQRVSESDSFWSWRSMMYQIAGRLDPADLEAIATWLYIEMLEAGYTHVCEFHYVHHDAEGQPYADSAELCLALLRAAERTSIGMTLLPVLYQRRGFFDARPTAGQRRFVRSTDDMLTLLQRLGPVCAGQGARLGAAPHSLRAVPPDALAALVEGMHGLDASAPIHIHVAEQSREVEECIAHSGQRPVEWLLDHAPVDRRWCLVHATHMDANERARAAASGAVAGLCPSTEANLGDGLFDYPGWRAAGGAWGIGSDSNVTISASEELMLLEYGQRLALQRRNVTATEQSPNVATALTLAAVHGGSRAAGLHTAEGAGLSIGSPADLVILDAEDACQAELRAEQMLSASVFACSRKSGIAEVWTRGRRRVTQKQHSMHVPAAHDFVSARARLLRG